jgi:hypothetical protein
VQRLRRCYAQADTLQYEYRVITEEHADAGNQFIPVRTSTSEHTSSIGRVLICKSCSQGLEERFRV